MDREAIHLLREAEALAKAGGTEFARFNAERARLLRGQPVIPGERVPLAFSGVGGDLPENA